jgi:Fic-DOC domain mobile mystery protein B/predicted DNA-binding mobile mystery protein A
MSTSQLAKRLGITQQAVSDLERREKDGRATIGALAKAARAMGGELVYAIVPTRNLDEMLQHQARTTAQSRLNRVAHSMGLEGQSTSAEEQERQVAELAAELLAHPRRLWEDEGLIPPHITTRGELNAWEQANILRAQEWLVTRRSKSPVIDIAFLLELHRRMFSETWEWAGEFRKTMKNLGVAPELVPERTQNLLDDVQYWLDHEAYPIDEIAARFHHLLVAIHPFPNGNGRHARLMVDALLRQVGASPFSWGAASLDVEGAIRKRYIGALQAADAGDYAPLLSLIRT